MFRSSKLSHHKSLEAAAAAVPAPLGYVRQKMRSACVLCLAVIGGLSHLCAWGARFDNLTVFGLTLFSPRRFGDLSKKVGVFFLFLVVSSPRGCRIEKHLRC